MSDPQRFALCGGTFDPIHRGHVEPVMGAYEQAGWSRVIFIPAYLQPFKTDRTITSAFHRFAMAVLATEEDARIEVSPIELERGQVSYTIDTLEKFRQHYPDATFDWIIGDDNLKDLHAWRSIEQIFQLANFAVLNRSGIYSVPPELTARVRSLADRPRNGAILFLKNALNPTSSTEVRRRLGAGESAAGLVHPRVEEYIRRNHLYRSVLKAEQAEVRR